MKTRDPDPDDLPIGPDQWIEFIDLTGRYDRALPIDDLLTPVVKLFFARIETDCDVECCGISAFNFLPDSIAAAQTHLNAPELIPNLRTIRTQLHELPTDVLSSRCMNQIIDKGVFLKLLDHLIQTLENPSTSHNTKT